MKIQIKSLWLILLVAGVTPAQAQNATANYELTPFAGYRVGGTFTEEDGDGRIELGDSSAVGLIFNIRAHAKGQYELFYSHQSTDADFENVPGADGNIDLDVQHLQFGGTYLFDGDLVRPFIALTLGGSHFSPKPGDLDSESYFSGSFGAGLQIAPSRRLGLRLEARALTTFVNSNSRIFCESDGGSGSCLIQIDSDMLTQWEARAGLVFRF